MTLKFLLAIEKRKKTVSKQLKVWGGSISTVFSFLLIIGFSTDDITTKIRTTLMPTKHIVNQLINGKEQSENLKKSIISELDDPSFKKYPKTQASLEENVWKTLSLADDEKLKYFIKNSNFDEIIIDSYYDEVINILFSDKKSKHNNKK